MINNESTSKNKKKNNLNMLKNQEISIQQKIKKPTDKGKEPKIKTDKKYY